MAWRAPSITPQRLSISSWRLRTCSESLMSSSITSGGWGSRWTERWVRRRPRPNPVQRISAPSSWATRAACHAIESSVSTPVINSFLPSSSIRLPPVGGILSEIHAPRVHAPDPEPHDEQEEQPVRQGGPATHLGPVDVSEGEREGDEEAVEHVLVAGLEALGGDQIHPQADLSEHDHRGGAHRHPEGAVRLLFPPRQDEPPCPHEPGGGDRHPRPGLVECSHPG